MRARTVGELKLKPQTINLQKIGEEWPFVKRGEVASMENAVPRVIIGQDNWPLIFPRKSFYGPWNGPVISMTWLGWVLHGKLPQKLTCNERVTSHIHFAHWEDVRDEEEDDRLTELVAIEKVGTEEENEKLKPLEDDVAIAISDETTKRTKGGERRKTGLLWPDFKSSESRRTAANRLRTLKRKMDRDSEFADENCVEMNECFDKGNARVLSTEEANRVMETIPAELSATVQGENMTDSCFAYSVKRVSMLPLELRAHRKKFVHNVYVASRVLDILERSNADEWRWVPTKKNPADLAPRENPKQNLPI
ncbi:hypothetical protein GE061_001836 [Apolygus lucorum]|uniref:Uncharacterized protein n=1 Tax=Apolygus lucorum TaxID=248454 RepID=A0A8S9X7D6_APOLU|nr:hypothetical protein GE061_001836 [Apolygus lucorum]